MSKKQEIKDITAMAKKLVNNEELTKDMTPDMQNSIDAVASQIEQLAGGNADLKALMGQIKEAIGVKSDNGGQ